MRDSEWFETFREWFRAWCAEKDLKMYRVAEVMGIAQPTFSARTRRAFVTPAFAALFEAKYPGEKVPERFVRDGRAGNRPPPKARKASDDLDDDLGSAA